MPLRLCSLRVLRGGGKGGYKSYFASPNVPQIHFPSLLFHKILLLVWFCVSSIKTDTRRVTRLDELPFVIRLSRCISKSISSRRITRLVSVFLLETYNQTNNKMFAEARPDG